MNFLKMESLPRELVLDIYDFYKAGLKQRWFALKVKWMEKILKFPVRIFRHHERYFYACGIHRWRVEYKRFLVVQFVCIFSHNYHMETNRLDFHTPFLILYQ